MALISFGEVLIDMLPCDERAKTYQPCAGGAPANVAVAFACLGGESFFIGGLAVDAMASLLTEQLISRGVDIQYCPRFAEANTSLVLVSLDAKGERDFRFYRQHGADMLFTSRHWDSESFKQSSLFHCCSNMSTTDNLHQTSLAGLSMAHENHLVVSLDINLREALWKGVSTNIMLDRIEQLARQANLIKVSTEELQRLAQLQYINTEELVNRWLYQERCQLVIVTDGGNQVCAHRRRGILTQDCPNTQVVDTTGAGDAFVGALLFHLHKTLAVGQRFSEWLEDDCLADGLELAVQNGALACQQKGAFEAMPVRQI